MSWQFPYYQIERGLDWQALERDFDWVRDMRQVPQDPIWHAEGNVFVHTQMVIEALQALPEFQELSEVKKHILVTAALLHDVEKRSTTTEEIIAGKKRIVAPKHAKKGASTAQRLLYQNIATPFDIRQQIVNLVALHGLPLWAIERENPSKAVIRASLEVDTKLLALLAKSDVLGRICADQEALLLKISLFEELCREAKCWGKARTFPSSYGRFYYLNRREASPDYQPYNDLDFTVYCLSALPGTGKDYYIGQHFDLPLVSLDQLRQQHKIAPDDKNKQGLVIQLAQAEAKTLLRQKQTFVFNATNINQDRRRKWISLFLNYGARVKIIYLEVPYEQLLAQNRQRSRNVPENVIERMIGQLEVPKAHEAHEIVYVIST